LNTCVCCGIIAGNHAIFVGQQFHISEFDGYSAIGFYWLQHREVQGKISQIVFEYLVCARSAPAAWQDSVLGTRAEIGFIPESIALSAELLRHWLRRASGKHSGHTFAVENWFLNTWVVLVMAIWFSTLTLTKEAVS
jgi:hypothetical protein